MVHSCLRRHRRDSKRARNSRIIHRKAVSNLPRYFVIVLVITVWIQVSNCFVLQVKPYRIKAKTNKRAHRINGEKLDHSRNKLPKTIPTHVAFVCDGNSRWARQRGLPVVAGHAAGADRLVDVVLPSLRKIGVKYCTMYGFSTENWKRSDKEVREIFTVMERTAESVYDRLMHEGQNVRIKILGDLSDERIPQTLVRALEKLQRDTGALNESSSDYHTLCLAVNYGGRRDILDAAKKLSRAVSAGVIENLDEISEDDFSNLLSTDGIPDPDLVIRTSGECRLSNFLTWNTAYSELYFTDTLWPDFDHKAMANALEWYSQRQRRFGARQEAQ